MKKTRYISVIVSESELDFYEYSKKIKSTGKYKIATFVDFSDEKLKPEELVLKLINKK